MFSLFAMQSRYGNVLGTGLKKFIVTLYILQTQKRFINLNYSSSSFLENLIDLRAK